jgi:hypothetical protein
VPWAHFFFACKVKVAQPKQGSLALCVGRLLPLRLLPLCCIVKSKGAKKKCAPFASPFAFCWLAFYCWQGCMPCLHQAYSASCCSQKQRLPLLLPSAGWPFTAGRAVCPACTRPIRPAAVVKSKGCLSCLSCLCKATLCFWRMLAKAKGAKVVRLPFAFGVC